MLKANAPERKRNINIKSGSLLTGLLYDATGDRLSPIHSRKPNGRRYRYYVSNRLVKGEIDDGTAFRLPANQLETHIIHLTSAILKDTPNLLKHLKWDNPTPHEISKVNDLAARTIKQLTTGSETVRTTILETLQKVEVHTGKLVLTLRYQPLLPNADADETISLEYPLQQKRRGMESKLVIGGQLLGEPDKDLIRIIAKARNWYAGLKSGDYQSINNIADHEKMDKGDVSRALPLAFLAPSIVSDIIRGEHPIDMTADTLRRKTAHLPLNWNEQRQFLGFDD